MLQERCGSGPRRWSLLSESHSLPLKLAISLRSAYTKGINDSTSCLQKHIHRDLHWQRCVPAPEGFSSDVLTQKDAHRAGLDEAATQPRKGAPEVPLIDFTLLCRLSIPFALAIMALFTLFAQFLSASNTHGVFSSSLGGFLEFVDSG